MPHCHLWDQGRGGHWSPAMSWYVTWSWWCLQKESSWLRQALGWACKRLLARHSAVPSQRFNFLPLLVSDSLNLLTFGADWSFSVFRRGGKTQDKFCWRIVREVIAAFNLLDLLAEVHVGRYFSSSLLLEAFLNACSLKLCSRYLVHPDLCPFYSQWDCMSQQQHVNMKKSFMALFLMFLSPGTSRKWEDKYDSLLLQSSPKHF